ncbi:MAG: SPOR domain-containing protein [Bacteriovoracaceae bacterium]|nr:SPOR domain-containing protein [Bacteriovoracaceae bacterium]
MKLVKSLTSILGHNFYTFITDLLHEISSDITIKYMEDKKLYIFDKKEIFLIFMFMLLVGITSFMLGVKIGKSFSFQSAGLSAEDQKKVELYSVQEEAVKKIVKESEEKTKVEGVKKEGLDPEAIHKKLKEKYDNLSEVAKLRQSDQAEQIEQDNALNEENTVGEQVSVDHIEEQAETTPQNPSAPKRDELSGKYTVQLAAYQSITDAERFADGFRVRGYNPIINEVDIPSRGVWFRVSLGVFGTISEAKDYVLKEKSLFRGTDYNFRKFD